MLLPLDTFREQMGYHPWHFWQWENATVNVTSACNGILFEYDWQDTNNTSRSEIRYAIETAEQRLEDYLAYSVAPRYRTDTLPTVRPYITTQWRFSNADATGRWTSVRLPVGYIQALGAETHTLINDTAAVVYSDDDGDGLTENFTITQATTVTNPDQIALYFSAADRFTGEGPTERWRVEPIRVSITAGVATIKGRAWMLARPILYEGANRVSLNPSTSANFVTTLAVYRRYADPDGTTIETSQGYLTWESSPWPSWACAGCGSNGDLSTDPSSIATAVARVGIRDARLGLVIPGQSVYLNATWSGIGWDSCRSPDQVTIRSLAGYPLQNGNIDMRWRAITARMTAAELPFRICNDNVSSHVLHRWQFDRARSAGANDEQYSISQQDLDNPFGTREGHIYAWRQVKNLQLQRGVVM